MTPLRSLLPLLVLLAAPGALTAQPTAVRKDVEALHAAMVDAFTKDPGGVAAFYTDDARILGGGGRYIGRAQVDHYWKQTPPGAQWTLEILEVGGDSLTPWVRGISTLRGSSGRQMVVEYVGLLRRQPDNSLKFYVDIYTTSPTPTRPAGDGR